MGAEEINDTKEAKVPKLDRWTEELIRDRKIKPERVKKVLGIK